MCIKEIVSFGFFRFLNEILTVILLSSSFIVHQDIFMRNIFKSKSCLGIILIILNSAPVIAATEEIDEKNRVRETELQWVVCEPTAAKLLKKVNADPESPKLRDVYYTETQNLDIYNHGAVIRTRVSKGENKKIKTAAKVNYEKEVQVPWRYLSDKEYKCEKDQYASKEKIGCSLYSHPSDLTNVDSIDQQEFIQRESGFQQWDKSVLLGPAQSYEWSWQDESLNLALVLEKVQVSKYYFNLELSVRVDINKSKQTFDRIQNWLVAHQVNLCPVQKGRTGELLKVLAANFTY
jgi:hypothetical protein